MLKSGPTFSSGCNGVGLESFLPLDGSIISMPPQNRFDGDGNNSSILDKSSMNANIQKRIVGCNLRISLMLTKLLANLYKQTTS
jgi:hypothetical protein